MQRPRHPLAQHPQAHHAHRKIAALARLAIRPLAGFHIGLVAIEFAKVADHGVADKLGHLHRHAGVVEPHHGGLRWQAQFQQGIDARANVENAFELRLLVKELLWRRPDHGMVGGGCAKLPNVHLGVREGRPEAQQPGLGFGIGATKCDFHGCQA